jgi:DNA-binding helix-hairpin-helix protein with protein kinase domain
LDPAGKAMELRTKLGEGGEGAVWASPAAADLVIKTYLKSMPAMQVEKLLAMSSLTDPTLLTTAAWPIRLVCDTSKTPVGFEMPKLSGPKPLHEIIGSKSRMKAFPNANWKMLVHTAGNLTRAFHALHTKNIVVGDVNSNNVVVQDDARVFFIDCDSFQIRTPTRTYRCEVGVPEYQPPELQNVPFGSVDRLPSHDLFGMAVMIFQLLFVGKHPFMGRLPNPGNVAPTIAENIVNGNYFYDEQARKLGLRPPPASLTLGAVTPAVAKLFEGAFRGRPEQRPTAHQWGAALAELEQAIITCKIATVHRYLTGTTCPWCAIELQTKIVYFAAPTLIGANGKVDDSIWATFPNSEVERLWREIAALGPPNLVYEPSERAPASPAPIPDDLRRRGMIFVCVLSTLFIIALVISAIVPIRVFALLDVAVAAGFWTFGRPRGGQQLADRKQRLADSARDFAGAELEWKRLCENRDFVTQRERLAAARSLMTGQRDAYEAEVAQIRRTGEQQAKRSYMDSQFIRDAKIKGIGRELSSRLGAYGIETALDIDDRVRDVPGIGEQKATALFTWRARVDSSFRFELKMIEGLLRDVATKYVQQRKQGQVMLLNGTAGLREIIDRVESRAPAVRAKALQQRRLLDQAEADMRPLPRLVYR